MDRNLNRRLRAIQHPKSLSARRVWIEIAKSTPEEAKRWVALRKESVDRNVPFDVIRPAIDVALRKESVDRNPPVDTSSINVSVALRKESVDRNLSILH